MPIIRSKISLYYRLSALIVFSPCISVAFSFFQGQTEFFRLIAAVVFSSFIFAFFGDLYEIGVGKIVFTKFFFIFPLRQEISFQEIDSIFLVPIYNSLSCKKSSISIAIKSKNSSLIKVIHLSLFSNHSELLKVIAFEMDNIGKFDLIDQNVRSSL